MRDFIIVTDSTVDLPESMLEEQGIPVLQLNYVLDGKTYEDRKGLSGREFFDKLREGSMPTTSQVNPEQAKEFFESFVKKERIFFVLGLAQD